MIEVLQMLAHLPLDTVPIRIGAHYNAHRRWRGAMLNAQDAIDAVARRSFSSRRCSCATTATACSAADGATTWRQLLLLVLQLLMDTANRASRCQGNSRRRRGGVRDDRHIGTRTGGRWRGSVFVAIVVVVGGSIRRLWC